MRFLVNKKLLALSVIIFLNLFVLYKLIFFPYPEFFIYPYLTNQGLIPYSQILDQHFPGLMFLPINFDSLGMTNPQVARIWLVSIVSLIHLLIFLVSKKLFKNSFFVIVPNLVYLIWQPYLEGWVFWIDSILPLFYLLIFYISLLIFLEKKVNIKLFVLLGFLCSLAVLFKQVALPLSMVLFLSIWFGFKKGKYLWYFTLGFLPLTAFWIVYFWHRNALADLIYWTVWFNLTTFAKYGRKGPSIGELSKVLFIFLPAFGLFFLKERRRIALLVGLFILGSLAGAFDRFDFVHLQPALPFLAIGIGLVLENFQENRSLLIVWITYFLIAVYLLFSFYRHSLSDRVLFYDPETLRVAQKIRHNTTFGEEIFLLGVPPHLYQLSNTIPTGRIFVFQFPWFMMETEDRILGALKENSPKLIVEDKSIEIEGREITEYMEKTVGFIDQNYKRFDNVGQVEFLKLKNQ